MNNEEMKALADKIEPVNKRIVVLRDTGDEMIGDIHIPEAGRRKFNSGVIISKSEDCDLVSVGVRIGYQPFAGVQMDLTGDGEQVHSVVVLRQEDITMILKDGIRVQKGAPEQ